MLSLNQKGLAHTLIIAAIVLVAGLGLVGYKVYTTSDASTKMSRKQCTDMLGRGWKDGKCMHKCFFGAGKLVVADPYDYCSKAASKISSSICSDKHRRYVFGVCLKKWRAAKYNLACLPKYPTYHKASPYDYCSVQ